MKKAILLVISLGILNISKSQIRTSLYEEFSGENFGIWYPANPNLHITLQNNASAVIPITWAVPLPSAPSPSYSLYQSNKAEINWRYKSSSGSTLATGPSTLGYGYPSQNTSSAIASNGINTGFTGRLDGQNTWVFGAASDDPADITSSVLLSAQSQTTNFRIVMSPSWSPTFTNCVVNVTLSSSTSFTALGDFYFRLCLVEREVHFPNPPGINGEKDFYDVVRRSYPTTVLNGSVTAMGTQVSGTWTPGQTQTLSLSCAIPSSIRDISLMDFVGFLQDDGDRKVYQAARTGPPAVPGDMRLSSILIPLACTNTFTPVFVAENLGSSAISGLTLSPYIDGLALPAYIYSATVVGNSSFQIALPSYTAAHGAHVFSLNISGVNGGDMNMVNNSKRVTFGISTNHTTTVAEPFASFPPQNWYVLNYDFEPPTWTSGNTGGFGNSLKCAKYDFWNLLGWGVAFDDLLLPVLDLSSVTNPYLAFDVAYAQYTNQNDKLEVQVSNDCGNTWNTVYSKQGSALSTAPAYSVSAFLPSASQWRRDSVNLPALANQADVLVKFVATSDYGNNLFIDNVNIGAPQSVTTTALSSYNKSGSQFVIFPNPASDYCELKLQQKGAVTLTVVNALGQIVFRRDYELNQESNTLKLDTSGWADGVYGIQLSSAEMTTSRLLRLSH